MLDCCTIYKILLLSTQRDVLYQNCYSHINLYIKPKSKILNFCASIYFKKQCLKHMLVCCTIYKILLLSTQRDVLYQNCYSHINLYINPKSKLLKFSASIYFKKECLKHILDGCTIYKILLLSTQRDVLYKKKKSYIVCTAEQRHYVRSI